VNVALSAGGRIVTVAGIDTELALLLESVMTAPPAGGAALSVIVPVESAPATTVVGLRATDVRMLGTTVSVALCVVPERAAEIVTSVAAAGLKVVTVKVAVVAPTGTVTLAGTVATAVLLLERVTTVAGVDGAGPLSVTVPVDGAVPATVAGLSWTEIGASGCTWRAAVFVTPL
jgi:hypothetical protein